LPMLPFRTVVAGMYLLHRPAVAIRVAKEDERAPGKLLDLAHLDAPPDQLRPGGVDVGHDQLEALGGARRRVDESFPQGNRAGRPRRCQLHEPDFIADRLVVVRIEADLLRIEGLGAVDVRNGDGYQFELPVHDAFLPSIRPVHSTWHKKKGPRVGTLSSVAIRPTGPDRPRCSRRRS